MTRNCIVTSDNPECPYTFAWALNDAMTTREKAGHEESIAVAGAACVSMLSLTAMRQGGVILGMDAITRLGMVLGVVFVWTQGVGWDWCDASVLDEYLTGMSEIDAVAQ